MGESVYQSSSAELQLYSEDIIGAASAGANRCFSQQRQQQEDKLLRMFSSPAEVAVDHSSAAADEPLDFSTRKRGTVSGSSRGVGSDVTSLASQPRYGGCTERQLSLDSGIGDGCCIPPPQPVAAVDFRVLATRQQQQQQSVYDPSARHRTLSSSTSPPTDALTSPSAAAAFADEHRGGRLLSPGGDGSVAADAFLRSGDEPRAGVGTAAAARASWAAMAAAASGTSTCSAGYGAPSSVLPAELQAAAAAGYSVGINGALSRPSVWQMALNPVAAAAAAAAALMQGDCEGLSPSAERTRNAAEQTANGRAAAAAAARLVAKAAFLKEFGVRSISNGYYPPLTSSAGSPAGCGATDATTATVPGVSAAAAAAAAAVAAEYPLTMQAMRSQSEELFLLYKRQLLDSQEKQKRAVREATSRRLSAAPLHRGARQRRQLLAAAAGASGGSGAPESSPQAVAAVSLKDACASTCSRSSLKDACSSTCSRSSLSSDGGEASQQGYSASAAASPESASNAGGSGNTAGGDGALGSGDGSCDAATAADSTGRVESAPPAPHLGGTELQPEQISSPVGAVTASAGQTSPASRKRGRAALNDEQKDVAYWERRRKNNEAAKRSRDARRAKEDEIAIRAAFLEQENLRLRVDIASLKQEADKLRCLLYSAS